MTEDDEFADRFAEESQFADRFRNESPKPWVLDVTSRPRGLIKTVVASVNGENVWQFNIMHTQDGFVRRISATRL